MESGYAVAEVSRLLALTEDAVRKRAARHEFESWQDHGRMMIERGRVDAERAALLQRLGASENGVSAEHAQLLAATVRELRAEVRRLKSTMSSIVVAAKAQQEGQQAVWDAVSQLTLPDDASHAEVVAS